MCVCARETGAGGHLMETSLCIIVVSVSPRRDDKHTYKTTDSRLTGKRVQSARPALLVPLVK